jgi:hypothetical protein
LRYAGGRDHGRRRRYLKDKIEREASFYETRAGRIGPTYLAQVEKLAERSEDPLLADYFRKTLRPESIVSAVADIRRYLKAGQIIEADKALDSLKENVAAVVIRLNDPIFRTGAKQRKYLHSLRAKINAEKKRVANEQHQEWRAEARNVWKRNPELSVSRCAKIVIKNLKLKAKPKTVADAIRNLNPKKKVGDTG